MTDPNQPSAYWNDSVRSDDLLESSVRAALPRVRSWVSRRVKAADYEDIASQAMVIAIRKWRKGPTYFTNQRQRRASSRR
jgi:hypothetical protein